MIGPALLLALVVHFGFQLSNSAMAVYFFRVHSLTLCVGRSLSNSARGGSEKYGFVHHITHSL